MKLTHLAMLAIKGGGSEMVMKLADALNASPSSVYRYIKDNDDELTKAAALEVIREETGLSDDQILERESAA